MTAHLRVKKQGIMGNAYKDLGQAGALTVSVDYDGTNDRRIFFDAFEGYGKTYKKREETLITIYDKNGYPVYSGGYDHLIDILK